MRFRYWALSVLLGSLTTPSLFAQRELQNIPSPDPEIEKSSFIVAEGMEVNLFAGDPMIAKPIHMNFDERGRLWIASSEVYPHIKPGQEPTDKILVVEDTDGDGVSDKRTVFADGLLIPTGILPGDGGCYVANSTELIHLADTDGDGVADQKRVVLSGFGTEDTHHLLHSLRWGHDGQIYMNQSIYIHSHVETPYGVKHMNGGGIWQFRPETLELNTFCLGFVNPWGHHFDHWGQSFATDGAYGEGINYVFPGSVFVTSPNAKRILHGLNPGSPKHCGLEIVSGSHLPDDWQGNMITNDFRANRVCRFVVDESRAAYVSRQEVEVIKSNHIAFRPIDVKVGADGAIYVADWYNPIIQHGEVDFRDPRRDHVHGRIWRVSAKGRPTVKKRDFANASVADLLAMLHEKEEWIRLHAKLNLKQRGAATVTPELEKWIGSLDPKSADYEHARLEGLWVYQNLNVPNWDLVQTLAQSPDHRVRAATLRVASQWLNTNKPLAFSLFSRGVADEHPRVRLEAVRGLSGVGTAEAATVAAKVLDQPLDDFLDFAIWQTFRDLSPAWLPKVQSGELVFGSNASHLAYALKAVEAPGIVAPLLQLLNKENIAANQMREITALVASLGDEKELAIATELTLNRLAKGDVGSVESLRALIDGSRARKLVPATDLSKLKELTSSKDETTAIAALNGLGAWKVNGGLEVLTQVLNDANSSLDRQVAAVDGLVAMGTPEALTALTKTASTSKTESVATRSLRGLGYLNTDAAVALSMELFANEAKRSIAVGAFDVVVSQKDGQGKLSAAFADKSIPADVAKNLIRIVRSGPSPDQALIDSLQKAGKLGEAGWKHSAELVAGLVTEVNEKGNPQRGEMIYRRKDLQCLNCHAVGGSGGKVGPDLLSIGASAPVDYLIDSLITPNSKVKENYHSKTIQTDSGEVVSGIVLSEADGVVSLRKADGTLAKIRQDEIVEMVDGRSLMPDGIVDSLTREELVDLTSFLSKLGKVGDYSLAREQYVRSWQVLDWTQEANHVLNRTSYDSAATDNAALKWSNQYSLVSGQMPLDGLPVFVIHPNTPKTVFARFKVSVAEAGNVALKFNDAKGVKAWIAGKPTPIEKLGSVAVEAGTLVVTLAIDTDSRKEPVRVEVSGAAEKPATVQVVLEP